MENGKWKMEEIRPCPTDRFSPYFLQFAIYNYHFSIFNFNGLLVRKAPA
jgi:hypothetical protein